MTKLYVGNLPWSASEDDIRELFSPIGVIESVSLITDRETGRSRGFAFVEMHDRQAGQEAIKGLNLQQLDGRALTVNEARPRENRVGDGGRGRW